MLYLHGIGHFHPENVIDNEFLANLDIGSDSDWIMERVGIARRRTVLDLDYIRETRNSDPRDAAAASLYTNAQTAARAARMAIERAGISKEDIGLVISGGCSPQYTIPAEACIVAAELGLDVPGYDLNSACSSFAVQLHHLMMMKGEALPDYVLVVNPENNTRTVDYNDRSTAVLWGDGTAATIVSNRVPARFKSDFSLYNSDPSGWNKVSIACGSHFKQEGSAVQGFAIRRSVELMNGIKDRVGEKSEEMYFIGHQANLTMLRSICTRVGIQESKFLYNVDEFGNCGAAGAPTVLSMNWNRFADGDRIGLVVVGSGLTWGGLLIEVGGAK